MDVELILTRVEEIRGLAWDDERAHSLEDQLWRTVLEDIAAGAENPSELAAAVLQTTALSFVRWYA